MSILKWDPLRELQSLHERLNRIYEQGMVRSGLDRSPGSGATWTPPVDMFETDEAVVLRAELPGVDGSDIRVEVKGGELVLSGERRMDREVSEESYLRIERSHGKFQRSFRLPDGAEADRITAGLKYGVLEVVVPKGGPKGARRIQVG